VTHPADMVLAVAGVRPAGSLGTQVVKIFDQAAARTGPRDHEAAAAGLDPVTIGSEADDHKAYYPRSHPITTRFTGDPATGRLLGVQPFGHRHAQIAKRIDTTAISHSMTIDAISDLDPSYTPPLDSPWEATQMGAQAWLRQASHHQPAPARNLMSSCLVPGRGRPVSSYNGGCCPAGSSCRGCS
jgi:hypothetical protein